MELVDVYTLWAHQVKTPIAALDLLLQTEPDSTKTRQMKNELFKIEQYIALTLHIARLDEGVSDYVFTKVDLEDVIRCSVRKYRNLFIEKHLQFHMVGECSPIVGDAKWVGIVIEQLISNSVKYTQQGRVSVTMDGTTVTIEDTGVGIHPEDIPRVFEKGFTGYNGRMEQKSTGIGLYVVKRMCDRFGIEHSLTSEVGKGTCVTLTFIPYKDVRFD